MNAREAKAAARHLARFLAATAPEAVAAGGVTRLRLELSPAGPDGRVKAERIRVLGPDQTILFDGPGSVLGLPVTTEEP